MIKSATTIVSLILMLSAGALLAQEQETSKDGAKPEAQSAEKQGEAKDTESPLVKAARESKARRDGEKSRISITNDDVKKSDGKLIQSTTKPLDPLPTAPDVERTMRDVSAANEKKSNRAELQASVTRYQQEVDILHRDLGMSDERPGLPAAVRPAEAPGISARCKRREADLILLNTCSIREKSENKVLQPPGELRLTRREGARIGLCGCVAQQEGEAILKRAPWVDFVMGPATSARIDEILEGGGNSRSISRPALRLLSVDRPSAVRAQVTIIEGCNKNCTFCIVPVDARQRDLTAVGRDPDRGPLGNRAGEASRSSCSARRSTPTAARSPGRDFAIC
jgi:hypothetical protein